MAFAPHVQKAAKLAFERLPVLPPGSRAPVCLRQVAWKCFGAGVGFKVHDMLMLDGCRCVLPVRLRLVRWSWSLKINVTDLPAATRP